MESNVKRNVSEIKRLCQERKEAAQALLRFLMLKGLSLQIAEEITLALTQEGKEMSDIKEILAASVQVTGELSFTHQHKLVFIGPTGVGKTTTILKLAQYYLKQKRSVAIVAADVAKKEALQIWCDKHQIPLLINCDKSYDLLLIDTDGCNFYLPNRVEALAEKISDLGEGLDLILTLSAAAKEVDLYGAVHQFSPLRPTCLTFTKLDETLTSGIMINVLAKSHLPIRYMAYGYPLPGNVQVADPYEITHKILTDFNNQEFQFIRQIALTLN